MTRLSAHLHEICAFEADLTRAADTNEASMRRYGPVQRWRNRGVDEALARLLPLASFASRYLHVPWSGWTLVLRNERVIAANDVLISLSKELACRGMYGSWATNGCMWRVVENGELRRAVHCFLDSDRWEFYEEGARYPFEHPELYEKRRKKDRMPPAVVLEYLQQVMGVPFPPDWRSLLSQETVCLERSTHKLRRPIEEYAVEVDI